MFLLFIFRGKIRFSDKLAQRKTSKSALVKPQIILPFLVLILRFRAARWTTLTMQIQIRFDQYHPKTKIIIMQWISMSHQEKFNFNIAIAQI
jgi:hypothetical protein